MAKRSAVLAIRTARQLDAAVEELYEIGLLEGTGERTTEPEHYVVTTTRVGRVQWHALRAAGDDLELLSDMAKQLVISEIPFQHKGLR